MEMGGRVIERMRNQLKIKTHQGKLVILDLPRGGPAPTKEENDSDLSASDSESLDEELVGEECQDTRGYGADFFKQIDFDEVSSESSSDESDELSMSSPMDSRPLTMFRRKTNVLFEKKSEAVISKLKAIAENNEEANSNEMLSAIEHLKTELKAAYSEVEKLTKVNNNRRKGDFHLSFLFSSPLIRKKNNNIEEVSQINYL